MSEQKLLLFRKWDTSEIEINDLGLKTAISLKQIIMPLDFGRSALKRYNKGQVNIVERLANKVACLNKTLFFHGVSEDFFSDEEMLKKYSETSMQMHMHHH